VGNGSLLDPVVLHSDALFRYLFVPWLAATTVC
jgi:hypothetical protein